MVSPAALVQNSPRRLFKLEAMAGSDALRDRSNASGKLGRKRDRRSGGGVRQGASGSWKFVGRGSRLGRSVEFRRQKIAELDGEVGGVR